MESDKHAIRSKVMNVENKKHVNKESNGEGQIGVERLPGKLSSGMETKKSTESKVAVEGTNDAEKEIGEADEDEEAVGEEEEVDGEEEEGEDAEGVGEEEDAEAAIEEGEADEVDEAAAGEEDEVAVGEEEGEEEEGEADANEEEEGEAAVDDEEEGEAAVDGEEEGEAAVDEEEEGETAVDGEEEGETAVDGEEGETAVNEEEEVEAAADEEGEGEAAVDEEEEGEAAVDEEEEGGAAVGEEEEGEAAVGEEEEGEAAVGEEEEGEVAVDEDGVHVGEEEGGEEAEEEEDEAAGEEGEAIVQDEEEEAIGELEGSKEPHVESEGGKTLKKGDGESNVVSKNDQKKQADQKAGFLKAGVDDDDAEEKEKIRNAEDLLKTKVSDNIIEGEKSVSQSMNNEGKSDHLKITSNVLKETKSRSTKGGESLVSSKSDSTVMDSTTEDMDTSENLSAIVDSSSNKDSVLEEETRATSAEDVDMDQADCDPVSEKQEKLLLSDTKEGDDKVSSPTESSDKHKAETESLEKTKSSETTVQSSEKEETIKKVCDSTKEGEKECGKTPESTGTISKESNEPSVSDPLKKAPEKEADTPEVKTEPGVENSSSKSSSVDSSSKAETAAATAAPSTAPTDTSTTSESNTVAVKRETSSPGPPNEKKSEKESSKAKDDPPAEEKDKPDSTPKDTAQSKEKSTEEKEPEAPAQGDAQDSSGDAQKKSTSSSRTCAECGAGKGLKYQVLFQGKTRFLCSDICFKVFRGKQKLAPPPSSPGAKAADCCGICNREIKNGQGYFPFSGDGKPVCSEECMVKYQQAHTPKPSCAQCKAPVEGRTKCLTWETMEFCNEDCLGIYQATMGSHCAFCKTDVQRLSLGKYCVRFGADIRQFCSGKCLEEFKKGLKVCTFCQKDMSNTSEGFLAPIGDKFRDFCTSQCMDQYEALNAANSAQPSVQKCSVCQKTAPIKVQVNHKDRVHILCSDPCIAAFRYTQKIYATLCDTCHKFFNNEPTCLQIDKVAKKFCTKTCLNLFVLNNRKIVPCTWCKVKKYNFDMIERMDLSFNVQLFCSLNCLSMFRVSLNATSSRCVNCDHCRLNLPAQYHLTMSDASVRNFCSYPCVIKFQGQFTSVPTLTTVTPSLNRQQGPTPVGKATPAPPVTASTGTNSSRNTPVIANVMSLATPGTATASTGTSKQMQPAATGKANKHMASNAITSPATTNGVPVMREVHREVIVAPPAPRMVKNKMIMCKPLVQNKGVACKPHPCHKETQTDDGYTTGPTVVPIPVPIYIPVPMHMYTRTVPFPMPFPIPIPVPIFIPTTRSTTARVIKDIFAIAEKVPSNPYEAELLLMAEMCAAEEDSKNPDDEDEKMSLDDVMEEIKEADDPEAPKLDLPEPLEDLETAVLPPLPVLPAMNEAVPIDPNISPVVHLTLLSPDYILNEQYSEDSLPQEPLEPLPLAPTPTARRGKRGRGRGRGGGRGRKRQKIATSDSDEEWLPTMQGTHSSPYSPTYEATPEVISSVSPSPVVPMTVPTPKVPPMVIKNVTTPKSATVVPAVTTLPSVSPLPTVPPVLDPFAAATTTTSPLVVAIAKADSKGDKGAAGDASPDSNLCLKYTFGVNAWKHWVIQKNIQLEKGGSQARRLKLFKTELLQLSPDELNYSLCLFVKEVRKPNGEEYAPDSIYYLCLGIQLYLCENARVDNIFTDPYYEKFTECLNDVLVKHDIIGTLRKEVHFVSRIQEEILWESKQLGAHSPQVLLNTLIYFNTKQFHLHSVDDHLQLSFTYIMKGWRKLNNNQSKTSRCAVLRYYPPPARGTADGKKTWREDAFTYEQEENFEDPLRCPVKLYEFYLSKCPESIRTRNDLFYMCPERSCVPDSPVWYSTQPLSKDALVKMLQRIYLVREISVPLPPTTEENEENVDAI